jgi:plastocyanin
MGCSNGVSRGVAGAAPAAAEVGIPDYAFAPVTVAAGARVTWVERDPDIDGNGAHSVVADDGSFSSPVLRQGETFSFDVTRTVAYHCGIHNYMTGTISVR